MGQTLTMEEDYAAPTPSTTKRTPPPIFKELHREIMQVMHCDVFDGGMFEFGRQLSPKFFVKHNIMMGAHPPGMDPRNSYDQYEFEATFQQSDGNMALHGQMTNDGTLMGQHIQKVSEALSLKTFCMVRQDPSTKESQVVSQHDSNYEGRTFAANLHFQNPSKWEASYVQALNPYWALGTQLGYSASKAKSALMFGARYSADGHTFVMKTGHPSAMSPFTTSAHYVRKITPKVSVGSEVNYVSATKESHCSVGWKYNLLNSVITSNIDSAGVIKTVYEQQLNPSMIFSWAAEINHRTSESKFGVKFQMQM